MNPAQHILIALVQVYRWTLSPMQTLLFGPSAGCRFTPTCSQYAAEAVRVHGALTGSWLATKRICRCHPWGGCGCDPVPPSVSSFAFRVSGHPKVRQLETQNLKPETLFHGS